VDSLPLITVYIPCRNYARFLRPAVDSVIDQVYPHWELIVVDDGSTDETAEVMAVLPENERVRTLRNREPEGLRVVANRCLAIARGSHVLRLDADDLLHAFSLDILAREAMRWPDVAMFFTDYYYMDESGEVIGVETLPVSSGGYGARTFPPHGAGALVRRDAFDRIGLYDEAVARQDGHELWLKLARSGLATRHVPIPLFYYRQHGESLASDERGVLDARSRIKRQLAGGVDMENTRVVAIVPVKNTYPDMPDVPFMRYRGTTLLETAILAASQAPSVDEVVVTTDDPRVIAFANTRFPDLVTHLRDPELRRPTASIRDVLLALVRERGYEADTVLCLLSVHTPRRTSGHVQKAIDNLLLYDVDSVVAVYEDRSLMYQMGDAGLRPLNPGHQHRLRREREAVYVDTGAVRVFRARNLAQRTFLGRRIGHAVIPREDALQIKSPDDFRFLDSETVDVRI
jgi:CMP-N-acetylneuraminic acid synthetase/GT2 family glycosyltransferase